MWSKLELKHIDNNIAQHNNVIICTVNILHFEIMFNSSRNY